MACTEYFSRPQEHLGLSSVTLGGSGALFLVNKRFQQQQRYPTCEVITEQKWGSSKRKPSSELKIACIAPQTTPISVSRCTVRRLLRFFLPTILWWSFSPDRTTRSLPLWLYKWSVSKYQPSKPSCIWSAALWCCSCSCTGKSRCRQSPMTVSHTWTRLLAWNVSWVNQLIIVCIKPG